MANLAATDPQSFRQAREAREAREAAGVIDFTGEYMREEDLGEFDEEADALDMANLMEDDNNDEGGEYTIDPIDND